MKSNKQKRAELARRKVARDEKRKAQHRATAVPEAAAPGVGEFERVNPGALAPHTSWGEPEYVRRGFYEPVPFVCKDCGTHEVWPPRQHKRWCEVARGYPFTTATCCRKCRRRERDRRAAARKTHFEGLAKKAEKKAKTID